MLKPKNPQIIRITIITAAAEKIIDIFFLKYGDKIILIALITENTGNINMRSVINGLFLVINEIPVLNTAHIIKSNNHIVELMNITVEDFIFPEY